MMKKNSLKTILISVFTLFSLFLTAQGALPSDDIFKLQNVETGEFLTTAGGSSQPVTMSATGDVENTHWTFVASGAYYNIDSASDTGGTGILRAPGAGASTGAYVILSTLKAPPAADTDKTWTIDYDATTDTYRFGSRTTGRFLYQEEDGTVTHNTVPNTDDRSNWKLVPLTAPIPVDTPLGFQNVETGEFLTTAPGSNQPVTMSATGEAQNTLWTLVESGDYYNIDSASESGGTGILRAPGAGASTGAYVVLSTLKAPPAADTDKTWSIDYNTTTDTYRFGSRTTGRFLYQEVDGTVTHTAAPDTDNRSNWRLIPLGETPVETAPDEDTSSDLSCSDEFTNPTRSCCDLENPENLGTIDDRSCYSNYSESDVYGKTWGVYNITEGSNHLDTNGLQPRIERSLPRSQETGVGSYARFTGIVRILEVGDAGSFSQDGSYLIQAKGKHTEGGGSADPAICLYLAKPVYGTGINANKQVAFDIYAERILERGGEGSGREVVFLKRVDKDAEIDFKLEVGFKEDPNDTTKKIHYCNAEIGGDAFNFNIPDPERGLESGIRYGAYRVKGGRAQMRWANITYQKKEVADGDPAPSDVVGLRNVETGEFLTAAGGSSLPVTMSATGVAENTHWSFVESGVGVFYNIDSESESGGTGILRAPGAGGPGGAYVVVSTLKVPPAGDTDKTWTIRYDETTETYRFESRTSGRFMYQNEDGTVTHIPVADTDMRSVWQAIPISQPLLPLQSQLTSTNVSCAGADDGMVSVTVTGGIEPYTYLWSSGETTATISNLAAGTYSVTVTDALNSTITASSEITAPNALVVTASDNTIIYSGYEGAEQCATIGVTAVTGGVAPYQFEWSAGETTEMINACPNSTQVYIVIVTDANGCEATAAITVEVINVGCGSTSNSKVQMCHKGKTICVAQAAVQAHLDHGDTLGECTVDPANAIVSVQTFPNPFSTFIKANVEVNTASTVKLILLNMHGNPVAVQTNQVNNGGVETIELQVDALPIGIYYLQVFIENQLYSTELFIKN